MTELRDLLNDPTRAAAVPATEVAALLIRIASEHHQLAALAAALAARLVAMPPPEEDRLLDIDEAAARLCVTRDWLRRRPDLPFVVKLSDGTVRYSSRGIDRYIAARAGRLA